jgi:beta-glucosidase
MTSMQQRIASLLSQMTLDEKLAQLGSLWVYELLTDLEVDAQKISSMLAHGIGQITRVAGASGLLPGQAAELANQIQHYLIEQTRLGIPAIIHEECCAGYMAPGATSFPQAIGVASTWEPELVEQMATVIRKEMKAVGAHQALSPVLDITRDPRWGRVEETFGEDPYLVAQMGTAYIRGFQGTDGILELVATAKHFVGYGLPEGGMNWAPAHIPQRELREVFLYPFEAAVKNAKLQSVMNAYHELDGIPCGANKELLHDILRDEWGFDGLVVSDYFTIEEFVRTHQLVTNSEDAAVLGLEAGIDVELPTWNYYRHPLKSALEKGAISVDLVDRSVKRILEMKFKLGIFEKPYVDPELASTSFRNPLDLALSTQIARKSIILLKNEAHALPLLPDLNSIAVIGPSAHSARNMLGDYAFVCHVENTLDMMEDGNVFDTAIPDKIASVDSLDQVPTILDFIRDKVAADVDIHFSEGCAINDADTSGFAEAVRAAQEAEVAILFLGGRSGLVESSTCGEARDRADLNLPGVQQQLLEAVHATGTPTILVLVNGRPLTVTWADEHIPAILEVWLPGEEGAQAVVDVLFGDENPGGKLPITVPRHVGQVPIYYAHKPSGGKSHWRSKYVNLSNQPLYPFGFGLSYTKFDLKNLAVDRDTFAAGEQIRLSVEITNIGDRSGDEVIQVYGRDLASSVTRPVKQLIGFKRLSLAPEESKRVTFILHANQFGFYNHGMDFVLEPGDIVLMVGTSSADIAQRTEITISGEETIIGENKVFFSKVSMS